MRSLSITCAAVVLALAAAGCPKGKQEPTAGSGPPVLAKKISVSWGITNKDDLVDIHLATTDETGKQVSHLVGTYEGTCMPFKPAAEMNAITGVACKTAEGRGTELHAVVQGGEEIIVLQMPTTAGVTPDPMAREEVTRVKVPLGIAIEVAP